MAAMEGGGPLRAALAGLAAVAILLAVFLWLSLDATLTSRSEEAGTQAARARALSIARSLESGGATVEMAASSVDVPVAISVYSEEGGRIAEARANGGDNLAGLLPERLTGVPREAFSVEPIAANRRGVRMFAVALADRRVIAVALGDAVSSALVGTVVAYEAMTLAVVLAVIGYVIVRMRRVAVPRPLAAAHSAPAGAPRREADFVVETFHSVIDELQHKGRALELQSKTERARADRSELFSARIIAQMPTGLAVVDRSGRVTAANPSARELFGGLPRTRTDSVLYSEAFAETPELVSMVAECISTATAFQRREIHTGSSTPGGPRRWFGVSVSPIGEPGELPEAVLCQMTDLTEVVELRERVRAQENLTHLGEMAAGLAHELKNSFATIQGFAQLIANVAPERATEPADALVSEVGHLSRMVTDFLNFARPQELTVAAVNLADLLDAVLARLADRIRESEISVVREADVATAGEVLADETLLSRAIFNLVLNAIEALEGIAGPRRLTIGMSTSAPGEVCLTIRDNGPGIAEADADRIFIPFYTTRTRGYGIGLALTQKIVVAHRGRIEVGDAAPGAVFRCYLPAAQGDVPSSRER